MLLWMAGWQEVKQTGGKAGKKERREGERQAGWMDKVREEEEREDKSYLCTNTYALVNMEKGWEG